ncbi:golgin subfamily A member 6-like protein 6 [Leptopilina heterotoma]|uniref:golgin subfamily A member 6-like protein 6 n=1 Tax=Leptopilina heterotoma TaxID=63436 RepID=UPI001CA7C6FD|nr:golgin subfamily A member 6-like protein 6 [Leptopilina heterotoma]
MTVRSPNKSERWQSMPGIAGNDEKTEGEIEGEERELLDLLSGSEGKKDVGGKGRQRRSFSLTDENVVSVGSADFNANTKEKPGRPTNLKLLDKERDINKGMMIKFVQGGKGKEGDDKNKDKQESENKRENKGRKERKEFADLEELIKRMGESTSKGMEKINRNLDRKMDKVNEGLSNEIGGIKKMCEEWEKRWKVEKDKMYKKLNALEENQKETKEEVERELWEVREVLRESKEMVTDVKKRLEELECNKEVQVCREVRETGLEEKMEEVTKWMERTEREKRKSNIVVKGMKVERKDGKVTIEKIFREIGANVNIVGLKGVGGEDKERPKVWVVQLANEEQKMEVMASKNKLKGRKEIIEEDKTWKERVISRKLDQKKWEERDKGAQVKRGRECVWINGVKWVVSEATGEVVKDERNREKIMSEGRENGNNEKVFWVRSGEGSGVEISRKERE